ncbi:short-chain dehydrogenase [Rozella allomycis CSF55]|uniref:Short-chain dehydrogenase n=1 Tax=Rozella allomycis (strain CSF55) TaxID=988480 RepID=A0A4P9YLZ9_ROZAC|nr:short-chain dehydrogenase [Rozella allomycis CSF55]
MTKVILVTGASRGIGFAICKHLRTFGVHVVGVSRSESPMQDFANEKYKGDFSYVVGDVTDPATLESILNLVQREYGKLDGIVLNAGVIEPIERIQSLDMNLLQRQFDVNFFSLISLLQKFLPLLRQSKGRIVHVSSGAAENAYMGWLGYCCTKASMNMLNKQLSIEEKDIVSVAVRPGVVKTSMTDSALENGNGIKFIGLGKDCMSQSDYEYIKDNRISVDISSHVLAKLAIEAPRELSGQFLSWDDERLNDFKINI